MFSCGNGGSASIANHAQCDHVKSVRTATDLLPRVLSLSTNVELLTAIANDMGYENVFVYQLRVAVQPRRRAHGRFVVRPVAQYRASAHVGARSRPAHHRDHRLRRRRLAGR